MHVQYTYEYLHVLTNTYMRVLQDYLELVEKALEALMFVSGSGRRADVALEIAMTARKRNWGPVVMRRLAYAYQQGKCYQRLSVQSILSF